MKKDLNNVVIYNVLKDEDIRSIFDSLSLTDSVSVNQDLSYRSWGITIPEHILEKVQSYAEEVAGEKLTLCEYNFTRYEKSFDDKGRLESSPLLYPHTDEGFNESRLTFDYQIRSNVSWDICINRVGETSCYNLKDNEALIFSGTHQVHWRPKRIFKEGEFLEALFFNFSPVERVELSIDHINDMRHTAKEIYETWKMSPGITSNVKNFYNERYKQIKDE